MARTNYFTDMESKYNDNDEQWIVAQTPQDIQKSARKRIFKEMVNGMYDYEKFGKYFLNPKLLENMIVAADNELQTYTLLYNALYFYRQATFNGMVQPIYADSVVGLEFTHIANMYWIYKTIYTKLTEVKSFGTVAPLIDVAPLLYKYRADINY